MARVGRPEVGLPRLSIASKLYAIFALLATVTVALAIVAVFNARRHAALTGEFESAFAGALNVERVNALIYAAEMESRGIFLAPDLAAARVHAAHLRRVNDRIGDVVTEWQWSVRPRGVRRPHQAVPGIPPRADAARHRGRRRRGSRMGRQRAEPGDARRPQQGPGGLCPALLAALEARL